MWTYTYALPNGEQRKVYLLWYAQVLAGWGYNHAHEEAERYLQRTTKKLE